MNRGYALLIMALCCGQAAAAEMTDATITPPLINRMSPCSWTSNESGSITMMNGACTTDDMAAAQRFERWHRTIRPADLDVITDRLDKVIELLERRRGENQ